MTNPTHKITWGPTDLAANSSALEYGVFYTDRKIRILNVRMSTKAAVTARNTDFNTWRIMNATTTVAYIKNGPATSGSSMAKGAWTSMTVNAAKSLVTAGKTLKLDSVKSGSGLAVGGAAFDIKYEYVD